MAFQVSSSCEACFQYLTKQAYITKGLYALLLAKLGNVRMWLRLTGMSCMVIRRWMSYCSSLQGDQAFLTGGACPAKYEASEGCGEAMVMMYRYRDTRHMQYRARQMAAAPGVERGRAPCAWSPGSPGAWARQRCSGAGLG